MNLRKAVLILLLASVATTPALAGRSCRLACWEPGTLTFHPCIQATATCGVGQEAVCAFEGFCLLGPNSFGWCAGGGAPLHIGLDCVDVGGWWAHGPTCHGATGTEPSWAVFDFDAALRGDALPILAASSPEAAFAANAQLNRPDLVPPATEALGVILGGFKPAVGLEASWLPGLSSHRWEGVVVAELLLSASGDVMSAEVEFATDADEAESQLGFALRHLQIKSENSDRSSAAPVSVFLFVRYLPDGGTQSLISL